jgi:hypothetical protein
LTGKQYISNTTYDDNDDHPELEATHTYEMNPDAPHALPSQTVTFELRPLRINWDEKAEPTLNIEIKDFKGERGKRRTFRTSTSVSLADLKKYIEEAEAYWEAKNAERTPIRYSYTLECGHTFEQVGRHHPLSLLTCEVCKLEGQFISERRPIFE